MDGFENPSANQSMSPTVGTSMYASALRGVNSLSTETEKQMAVMAMFHGDIPAKFNTDPQMAPTSYHEDTLQMMRENRMILQESLFIRRSLNPQKLGLALLSPIVLVQALRVGWTRNEDLPVLAQHGAERTTGRTTLRRSEKFERQLDRWVGGDQFGIDGLLEDPTILDRSRAVNVDGLLSILDFNVWAEARRAHSIALMQNSEMAQYGGSSLTGHLQTMQDARFKELTFAFQRYTAPLTRITNQIEAWQAQYGGRGDTWFLHVQSDIVRRNAGTESEFLFKNFGPGAREAQTAGLGATLARESPSGKEVYMMANVDIAGVAGIDVMERQLTYGEYYIQGYPNCYDHNGSVLSSDATMHLMTVNNDKTVWDCWTLLDSLRASGMYNADGTPYDVLNQTTQEAKQRFSSDFQRRHSLYYATGDKDEPYVMAKFMGQLEQYSMSSESVMRLARSVIARLDSGSNYNAIKYLADAKAICCRPGPTDANVQDYIKAWATGKANDKTKIGRGLKPLIANLKEYDRDEFGGWELPTVFVASDAQLTQAERDSLKAYANLATATTALIIANDMPQDTDIEKQAKATAVTDAGNRLATARDEVITVEKAIATAKTAATLASKSDTQIASDVKFELPPMGGSYGVLRTVAAARAQFENAAEFRAKYNLSFEAATRVAEGLQAMEELSRALSRLLPGSVFNNADYAPDHAWNPTDGAALYNATIGADTLPLFYKQEGVEGKLEDQTKMSLLLNLGDEYAAALQDMFTGRIRIQTEKDKHIAANINAPGNAPDNAELLQLSAIVTQPLAMAALQTKDVGTRLRAGAYVQDAAAAPVVSAYKNLLALMFNTRPTDDVAPAQKAKAELNRTVLLVLASAIKSGDTAVETAANIDKFVTDVVQPAYGELSLGARNGDGANFLYKGAGQNAEDIRLQLNAMNKDVLTSIFDLATLRTKVQQLAGVFVRYSTVATDIVNNQGAYDAAQATAPGEWRRTPLVVGRDQFSKFAGNEASLRPADPAFTARVIQTPDLARAKTTTPGMFMRGDELRKRFPGTALNKHFVDMLKADGSLAGSGKTNWMIGNTWEQEASMYPDDPMDYTDLGLVEGKLGPDSTITANDLAQMANASFKTNWAAASYKATSLLEEVVAKTYLGQIHNVAVFEAAYRNDTLFPMRFACIRFLRMRTISALYAVRGGAAMQTPLTAPRFYQGSTVSTQEFMYNFHVWASPITLMPEYLYWADDVQIAGYYGGWSLRPEYPKHVRNTKNITEAGDIYVFVQPFENSIYPSRLPITGRRADYSSTVPSDVSGTTDIVIENSYANEILFDLKAQVNGESDNDNGTMVHAGDITGSIDSTWPMLHMGTARFETQTGTYIQLSSGPLESRFVNGNLDKALVDGRDKFYEEDISKLRTSGLVSAPKAVFSY